VPTLFPLTWFQAGKPKAITAKAKPELKKGNKKKPLTDG
jgi:hypothetical protein